MPHKEICREFCSDKYAFKYCLYLTNLWQCDAQRPSCTACVRRRSLCTFGGRPAENIGLSSSSSETPESRSTEAILLNMLISASDKEALDMLAKIRLSRDFVEALDQIRDTSPPSQQLREAQSTFPPDQGSVEFELMMRHPVLFPSDAALDNGPVPLQMHHARNYAGSLGYATPTYGFLCLSSSL